MNVQEAIAVAITHTTGVDKTPAPATQSLMDNTTPVASSFGTVSGYDEANQGK